MASSRFMSLMSRASSSAWVVKGGNIVDLEVDRSGPRGGGRGTQWLGLAQGVPSHPDADLTLT